METPKHVLTTRTTVRARLHAAALGRVSLIAVCALFGATAHAQNPGHYGSFVTTGGVQVWTGPGPVVTKPPASGVNWSRVFQQSGTNVLVKDAGAVALRNGAAVTLTASRAVSAANILTATRTLAGGPVGLALLVGMPLFQAWVNQDNTRIAQNSTDPNKPFEIRKDGCNGSTCLQYAPTNGGQNLGLGWFSSKAEACAAWVAWGGNNGPNWTATTIVSSDPSCRVTTTYIPTGGVAYSDNGYQTRQVPDTGGWLPASMDDIAPYLGPRPVPENYLPQLLDKGASVNSTPNGITGPGTAPAEPPVKQTTQVPTPAPTTSTTQRPGNPSGLAPNSPTVTSQSTGSTPTTVNGKPVNQPSQTTTESTYDPDTNRTTDTTTTTHTPIRVEETTTNTTNITYNTNTATATTTNNTTTNIINNITNTVINTTTTGGDVKPSEEQTDPCKQNPDALMCAKPDLDTPDGEIPTEDKQITYQEENLFGAGSCPANLQASIGTLGRTVTVWDWQKTCEYALPLRAIVIALASFAAFLIVMPGGGNQT